MAEQLDSRSICPVCRNPFARRADGKLRRHRPTVNGWTMNGRCPGSGQQGIDLPLEVRRG